MSQEWTTLTDTHYLDESRDIIQDMLDSLKNMFAGAALPTTDLVAWMMAVETAGSTINQRDAANTAWVVQGLAGERFWGLGIYAPKVKAITVDAEGDTAADTIRSTIQLEDAGGTNVAEQTLVDVWVGTADLGAPSATSNTVAFATGTVIQTITANAHYRVLPDATGLIELDLTVAGGATRFVMAAPGNAPVTSKELTFAA